MSITALNSAITAIRGLLSDLEDSRISGDEAIIGSGFILTSLPKEVKRKDVYGGLEGARGYDRVKADMSKATTVAKIYGNGLGKDKEEIVRVLVGDDGMARAKGWRRLYDAFTAKVKPGEWTPQEAWNRVQEGWMHPRYSKETEKSGSKRHLIVEAETGERFDDWAGTQDMDADLGVTALLDSQEDVVDSDLARSIHEYLGAGGNAAVLEARIRAMTARIKSEG